MPRKPQFLTICLNPVMQRTMLFPVLRENQVNRTSQYHTHASGKGVNVTRVLTQLGAGAIHLTHAGGRDRDRFIGLCKDDGLTVRWTDSGSEIRTCITVLSSAANTSTELVEEAEAVMPGTEEAVCSLFAELIGEADLLTISGSKAPGYSDGLYRWMTEKAVEKGVKTVLDIRGKDLELALDAGPWVIKPNLSEFCGTFLPEISNREHDENGHILEMVRSKMEDLYRLYGISSVLTRGSRGLIAFDGRDFYEMAAGEIIPLNTTGCGDAFTAGFSFAAASGESFDSALRKGTDCAAANAVLIKPGVIRA